MAVLPIIGLTILVILGVVFLPEVFLFLPKTFFPQSFALAG
jgi:hypothetical protein